MNAPAVSGLPGESSARLSAWVRTGLAYFAAQCYDALPTPVTLQKGQVRIADKLSFERLDAYSSPRLAEYHDSDPCRINFSWGQEPLRYRGGLPTIEMPHTPAPAPAAASSARLGVTVELQYTLGEYDIVSLSATQSDGLETWLRQRRPLDESAFFRALGFEFDPVAVENQRLQFVRLRNLLIDTGARRVE